MSKSALSIFFIFLFAASLLFLGLTLAEMGLQDVGGYQKETGALRLTRNEHGAWVVTFAGEDWQLPVVNAPAGRD